MDTIHTGVLTAVPPVPWKEISLTKNFELTIYPKGNLKVTSVCVS